MNFNFDNNRPIYIQLVEQLEMFIISGQISPGERLPSVRELALKTKVNPNTMQKALIELEDIGLIYTERTNGKFVTKDKKIIDSYREKYAKEKSLEYLSDMKNLRFSNEEIVNYLKKIGGIKWWNY